MGLYGLTPPGMGEPPVNVTAKSMRSRVLASLAILAIIILLLVWGIWGMQWTILTNNNLRSAVTTSAGTRITDTYSIPQGTQHTDSICVIWVTSSGCGNQYTGASVALPMPVSNSSITIENYIVFSMTNPNGSAVTVWYTGPQGNLTQDCNGSYPKGEITCTYEPTSPGVRYGPFSTFFLVSKTGNYSIHLQSRPCTYSTSCSSTIATGLVTLAASTIIYNRPYWAAGLVTVIVAGVSILATVGYLTVTSYQFSKQKPATKPPTRGTQQLHSD